MNVKNKYCSFYFICIYYYAFQDIITTHTYFTACCTYSKYVQ